MRGKLLAVGGAEDREGDRLILREFLSISKGSRARIVIATAATNHQAEVGEDYRKVFRSLGAADVRTLDVNSRDEAHDEKLLAIVRNATGVFFTGGDQLNITMLMGGTPLHRELKDRFDKGMALGGTSAGAAMLSNTMIIGGATERNPRLGDVKVGPGMDFFPGVVIDTHFSHRTRIGRLLMAVGQHPQNVGLGIDENTAILLQGEQFTVLGEGAVTVIDPGDMTYTNLESIDHRESLALHNIRVHILPAGDCYDLHERKPIVSEGGPKPATKERQAQRSTPHTS